MSWKWVIPITIIIFPLGLLCAYKVFKYDSYWYQTYYFAWDKLTFLLALILLWKFSSFVEPLKKIFLTLAGMQFVRLLWEIPAVYDWDLAINMWVRFSLFIILLITLCVIAYQSRKINQWVKK